MLWQQSCSLLSCAKKRFPLYTLLIITPSPSCSSVFLYHKYGFQKPQAQICHSHMWEAACPHICEAVSGVLCFFLHKRFLSCSLSPLTIHHHASIMAYLPKTSVFWEYTARVLCVHVCYGCMRNDTNQLRIRAWIHAFSLNKMEPYQLD